MSRSFQNYKCVSSHIIGKKRTCQKLFKKLQGVQYFWRLEQELDCCNKSHTFRSDQDMKCLITCAINLNNVSEAIERCWWNLRKGITSKVSQKAHFYSDKNRLVLGWGEHSKGRGGVRESFSLTQVNGGKCLNWRPGYEATKQKYMQVGTIRIDWLLLFCLRK